MTLDTPPHPVTSEKKKLIVVFGMHRSGTSALSRGLKALGINLGNNLMPPVPGNNEKGFWEDLDINSLSNDLLNAVDSRWDDVSDITHKLRSNPNLAEFKTRACQLLQTQLTGHPNFGFKDPRTCRLLPFWKEIFETLGNDVYYVVASRNPISVAQSLRKRDGFPEEKSYLLWLTHMLEALHQTAGSPRVVIDYDHLMDNPRRELLRIAEFLDIEINNGIERKIAHYEDEFLSDTLRHTHFDADALKFESRAPRIIRRFFSLCCRLAEGVEDVNSKNTINKIDKFYHQAADWTPAIGFAGSLDFEVSNMTQKNQQLSALAVERERRVVELTREVDILKAQELQAAERIESLNQVLDERERRVVELTREVDILKAKEPQAAERIGILNQELGERERRVVELIREVDNLKTQELQAAKRIESLNQVLDERDRRSVELTREVDSLKAQELQAAERIESLNQVLDERDRRVVELTREVDSLKVQKLQATSRSVEIEQALNQAYRVIDAMRASTSWRMTSFFRWCSILARRFGPLSIIRATANSRYGSNAFRSLPLSEGLRTAIKSAVFRRMGWLFKGSLAYRAWQARELYAAASAPEPTEDFPVDPGGGAEDKTMDDGAVGTKKRILVIDWTTPRPDCDAGSVTAYFFLKAFLELGYQVTFIPDDLNYSEKYTGKLRELGVRCITSREIYSVESFLKQRGRSIDIVVLYRVHTATRHLPVVKQYAPQAKIIFDTVDLHYLREERQACVNHCEKSKAQALQTKHIEFEMMRAADTTIVLSTKERELLLQEDADLNIVNIPLLLEISGSRNAFDQRDGIVFIGGFLHQPNIDGVCYFVRDIWPIVSAALPDVKFQVIGSSVPEEVLALGSAPNVEVLGFVEELAPVFDACRLSVVPLRFGAGIKGKIGTSASYGVPCVSTSIGVEGMELRDGIDVLVADDPQRFAEQVIRLYADRTLWEKMSEASLALVRDRYSYESGRELLRQLFSKLN